MRDYFPLNANVGVRCRRDGGYIGDSAPEQDVHKCGGPDVLPKVDLRIPQLAVLSAPLRASLTVSQIAETRK